VILVPLHVEAVFIACLVFFPWQDELLVNLTEELQVKVNCDGRPASREQ
jgi:hypothetical protein